MFHGKLHHVGIIVPDEAQLRELCRICGVTPGRRQYVAEYQADCIFSEGPGGVIEFIIPRGGKLAKFNKGFGGLHHIAIEVEDLNAASAALAADGVRLLESSPVDAGALLINFLPPVFSRGVVVEYVQAKKQANPAANADESGVATGGKP
jgi:catechol 2,3-dioxygenase-like lactoylglutathione lyase family enzyme